MRLNANRGGRAIALREARESHAQFITARTSARLAVLATICSVVATSVATLTVAPPASAAPKAKAARDVPGLPSTVAPKVQPEAGGGDFSDPPPPPAELGKVKPSKAAKSSFDPATSKALDDETTPTKKVYLNRDGTRSEMITAKPSRFRGLDGAWHDIDLTVAPAADGTLKARSAEHALAVPGRADGATTVETPAGSVTVRHLGASPVVAKPDAQSASYTGALGRRDLRLSLVADGVEELVVLPDAAAGGSYVDELTLPAGVSARDGAGGVELVGPGGDVVGVVANGWATDASVPPAAAAVSVRLLGEGATPAGTVAVEVSVDAHWLADAARRFPVVIDPTVQATYQGAGWIADSMVWKAAPTTNYGTFGELWVGASGTDVARSFIRFDALPPAQDQWVTQADLNLYNFSSTCLSTPRTLYVGAPLQHYDESTLTWNNQLTTDPVNGAGMLSTPPRGWTRPTRRSGPRPVAPRAG